MQSFGHHPVSYASVQMQPGHLHHINIPRRALPVEESLSKAEPCDSATTDLHCLQKSGRQYFFSVLVETNSHLFTNSYLRQDSNLLLWETAKSAHNFNYLG